MDPVPKQAQSPKKYVNQWTNYHSYCHCDHSIARVIFPINHRVHIGISCNLRIWLRKVVFIQCSLTPRIQSTSSPVDHIEYNISNTKRETCPYLFKVPLSVWDKLINDNKQALNDNMLLWKKLQRYM